MPITTQANRITDWLELEDENRFSRENITVAASQTLVTGQLVKADGAGNAIALTALTDTPIGIICEPITTGVVVGASVAVVRLARVVLANLVFGIAATDAQKLTIIGKLSNVTTARSV
jgi:Bacteriophage lambda head decoration protein D